MDNGQCPAQRQKAKCIIHNTIQCKNEKKASRKTTTTHHSAIATSFTAAASTSLMLSYVYVMNELESQENGGMDGNNG
jgi:hypothetical protein